MSRLVFILVASLALFVLPGAALSAGAVNPNTCACHLVLWGDDLGSKFKMDETKAVTNATSAKQGGVTMTQLKKWGRVEGWQVSYSLDTAKATRADLAGPLFISSFANVYTKPAGAHAAWLASLAGAKNSLPKGTKQLVVARIGDESRVFSYQTKANGHSYTVFAISWHSGNVTAALMCDGLKGKISTASAVRLALKQQARIRAAH